MVQQGFSRDTLSALEAILAIYLFVSVHIDVEFSKKQSDFALSNA